MVILETRCYRWWQRSITIFCLGEKVEKRGFLFHPDLSVCVNREVKTNILPVSKMNLHYIGISMILVLRLGPRVSNESSCANVLEYVLSVIQLAPAL